MDLRYENGLILRLGPLSVSFDSALCNDESSLRCITHAHADHVYNSKERASMMTDETYELLRATRRYERDACRLALSQAYRVGDVEIKPINSGHILGSCQYMLDFGGTRTLYTGDFNSYETIITRPAESIETDCMVLEATYGTPDFIFPDRELIYVEVVRWIEGCVRDGFVPAFKLYAIGKSQEVVRLVNEYLEVPVIVSKQVSRACEVYRRFGTKLSCMPADGEDARGVMRSKAFVYISNRFESPFPGVRFRWALATGWALRYRFSYVDAAFPLSSHADFKGIIEHVRACAPKRVYTMHGYSSQLAKHLRGMGYDATSLDAYAPGLERLTY